MARFDDQVWRPEVQAAAAQDELVLTLMWYSPQGPQGDAAVFLHVYDEGGQPIAQDYGYPLAGLFSRRYGQPGDLVRDVRHVGLPQDLADGLYTVVAGWYERASGQRLPAWDSQGQPLPNDAAQI